MEDDLNLDPETVEPPDPGDTPAGTGEGAEAEPEAAKGDEAAQTPAFLLEIDDRTKYTDREKAKRGFSELRGDRDRHKTRAEQLEEENRRLKHALGGEPDSGKPKTNLPPEKLAEHRRWLETAGADLGILTKEQLADPEVRAQLREIVAEAEEERLVSHGKAHLTKVLEKHEIQVPGAKREGLEDYVGRVIGADEALKARFVAGDMSVLDEVVEDLYAAHIATRSKAADDADGKKQQLHADIGREAEKQRAKERMKNLPAGPPKGGAAAAKTGEPPKALTPEEARRRMHDALETRLSATG